MNSWIIPVIFGRKHYPSATPFIERLKRWILKSGGECSPYIDYRGDETRLLCPDWSLYTTKNDTIITFPLTVSTLKWTSYDGTITTISLASSTWTIPIDSYICEIEAILTAEISLRYKLIEGSGNTLYDSSGENGHAYLNINTVWTKKMYTGSFAETGNYSNVEGYLYSSGVCIPFKNNLIEYADGTKYTGTANQYKGRVRINAVQGGRYGCNFSVSGAKVEWASQIIAAGESWTLAMRIKGGFPSSGYASLAGSKNYPNVESLYGVWINSIVGICAYTSKGNKIANAQPALATLQNYIAAGCSLVWRFNKAEDLYKIKFWINGYTETGWYINCESDTPATPYLYLSSLGLILNDTSRRYTGTMWDFRAWNTAITDTECAAYHDDTNFSLTGITTNPLVWLPRVCDGIDVSGNNNHGTCTLTAPYQGTSSPEWEIPGADYMALYGFRRYSTGITIPNGASSATQAQIPYVRNTSAIPTGLSISGTIIGEHPFRKGLFNGAPGWVDGMGDTLTGNDLDITGSKIWETVGSLCVQLLNKSNTSIFIDAIRSSSTYNSAHPGRFTGPGMVTEPSSATDYLSLIKYYMYAAYRKYFYLFHVKHSDGIHYTHAKNVLIYPSELTTEEQARVVSWGGSSE